MFDQPCQQFGIATAEIENAGVARHDFSDYGKIPTTEEFTYKGF